MPTTMTCSCCGRIGGVQAFRLPPEMEEIFRSTLRIGEDQKTSAESPPFGFCAECSEKLHPNVRLVCVTIEVRNACIENMADVMVAAGVPRRAAPLAPLQRKPFPTTIRIPRLVNHVFALEQALESLVAKSLVTVTIDPNGERRYHAVR